MRNANKLTSRLLEILMFLLVMVPISYNQRTFLDGIPNRSLRQMVFNLIGHTGDAPQYFTQLRKMGKIQKQFSDTAKFFCDTKNGPGRRSDVPPNSVHELRPGDVDIIAGMGDSLTAGNGAMSTNILQIITENKGISFSIGGQANWRKFLTIPNILKEFNPDLYGYALHDGLSTDRSSRFNVAELGAMSRDMPYQAKVLVKRMKFDPNVNMTHHWKLVTLLIGANDFCSDMCYFPHPEDVIDNHEKDLIATLRILRDNIPRLMVNVLASLHVDLLADFKGKPPQCVSIHRFECPCFFGIRREPYRKYYMKIIDAWRKRERRVINSEEFQNREDFTVNYQPFTQNISVPLINPGQTDFRYMATDCFHMSQKGYARASNALWNNMMEPEGQKQVAWGKEFKTFKCPTAEQPYLMTSKNSIVYNKKNKII